MRSSLTAPMIFIILGANLVSIAGFPVAISIRESGPIFEERRTFP